MPTYIDVHVLQSVPPSNLNRDDSGSPKQAMYGGARRARVSSQAWKRAARSFLADGVPEVDQATRTTRIAAVLTERLRRAAPDLADEMAAALATKLLEPLGIKPGKKDDKTAYLLFFGRGQLDALVEAVAPRAAELAELDAKNLTKELGDLSVENLLATGHPLDVALFGRMVADLPTLNVDAATQVAHAISTHAVEIEFDYFTAVDDEQQRSDEEGAGAAMIGTVEFNSATLYRFATVGLDQLVENLGAADTVVADGVVRFVDAFVQSMPTGKQNTFAALTKPDLVLVCVRDDQPVNFVSAFERPVWSRNGYLPESAKKLADEYTESTNRWGNVPLLTAVCMSGSAAQGAGDAFGVNSTMQELLDGIGSAVSARLETQEAS